MKKIIIALGGNALGNTPSEQKKAVKTTAKVIVDLYLENNNIVVVHGNGPQVGWINNSFMKAFKEGVSKEALPFPECGSMSQGYIGYHIQNAIQNELLSRKQKGDVISLISQTIVNEDDMAFKNPTKPIGDFMTEKEAKDLASKNNWIVKEDAGRGWRRVVASPKPKDIPSLNIIHNLLENNVITIVGGGGGIPVVKSDYLYGIDAVIDKDSTASFIARKLNADKFIILTAVNSIKINFGKENEKSLKNISLKELEKHILDKQFAEGSMLPKVVAAKKFVRATGHEALIGELSKAHDILLGKSGTKIIK